jgi:hypothetical protein
MKDGRSMGFREKCWSDGDLETFETWRFGREKTCLQKL